MDERFKKAEDEYFRLKGQLAAGRITQAQFEAALKDLAFQDALGRFWNLGPDSGKWYMHVGQNWVESDPATTTAPSNERTKMLPPPMATPSQSVVASPGKKSGGCGVAGIAIGLIVLVLLVAVIGGLFFASSQGILQVSLGATTTPTLNAAATSAVQASSTAQAQSQATATAQTQSTATAQAQATLTARALATSAAQTTATAQAQATTRAQQTVLAQATSQALLAYIDALTATGRKAYGPVEGVLDRPADASKIKTLSTNMSLRNMIVETRFFNPADGKVNPWDYGYLLRNIPLGTCAPSYRVYLLSNQTFRATVSTGSHNPGQVTCETKDLAKGNVPSMDVSPNGSNLFRIVMNDKAAFIFVNDAYVAALDTSEVNSQGDVIIGTGMQIDHMFPGLATKYTGFTVTSLP